MKNRPDRADVHQGGTRRRRMTSETQEGAPAVDSTVLDALARAVRGDHHAIAGVDSHMAGPPDDVAGLGGRSGNDGAGAANTTGGMRNGDAELAVDVLDQAGAVEGARAAGAVHVGSADVLHGGRRDGAG